MRRNARRVVWALALLLLVLAGTASLALERTSKLIHVEPHIPSLRSIRVESSIDWTALRPEMARRTWQLFPEFAGRRIGWAWEMLERQRLLACQASDDLCRIAEHPPEMADQLDEAIDHSFGFSLEEKFQAALNWVRARLEDLPSFSSNEPLNQKQAERPE